MKTDKNYSGIIVLILVIILNALFMTSCKAQTQVILILPTEDTQPFLGDILRITRINNDAITLEYDRHHCNWEDCPHENSIRNQHFFVSKWAGGYDEGTDGFYTELTHYMNPDWTYEQCEDYVMSGIE